MKKFLLLGLALLGLSVHAANYVVQPLLSGYNLYVTNGTPDAIGGTNNEYTLLQGPIVYSLTNNIGNTNSSWPDAFDPATFFAADANANLNTNYAIIVFINNTNWIPIAVTNSQGQYFIPTAPNTTNFATAAWATVWPLASVAYPTYMYPANTNLYPYLPNAASTNVLTLNFQRGIKIIAGTPGYTWWEPATNTWTTTITGNGVTPTNIVVNPPASWTQGFNQFRLNSVTEAANSATTGLESGPMILNGVWFCQWVP